MKIRRTLLALVLSVMMVIGLFPVTAMAADPTPVSYRTCDANGQNWTTGTVTEYTVIMAETTTWNSGWYVVSGNVTIGSAETPSRVTVTGDVHLILEDGCTLTVNGGIAVTQGNSLTIYAQSTSEGTMGKLVAQNVPANNAAIGGNNGPIGGTITINGGSVEAKGSNEGDNSYGIYATNVTVNGGSVKAEGGDVQSNSSGIFATNVTVNGGSVMAESGDAKNNSYGILATNVTVNGGSAVVFASSIPNWIDRSSWNGIVFVGNEGKVYGTSVAPSEDFTIPTGKTLTVGADQTLTIPTGVTLAIEKDETSTNNGILTNEGTIIVYGTVSGTISGNGTVKYSVTIVDGETIAVFGAYSAKETVTLTLDPKDVYIFAGWTSEDVEISADGTFEMPEKAVTVTANWKRVYTVTVSDTANGTITADPTSACAGDTVTLTATPETGYHCASWKVTGLNGENISVENDQFTMPAGNVTVSAVFEADVPVQPETPSEPEYIPIPDPDYTAPVYRNTWHKSGKNWYFYDEDGQKVKGWYKDGNTWYYLSEKTGAMVYGGMLEIDGETYYFYDWGGMASGWWYYDETDGSWYYFRGSGAMAKSAWVEWKGEWYYLGADGKMLTGTATPDGYRVDANGKWIR